MDYAKEYDRMVEQSNKQLMEIEDLRYVISDICCQVQERDKQLTIERIETSKQFAEKEKLRQQLAAAQAREQQLRAHLEVIAGKRMCVDNTLGNANIADLALSQPTDTTALQAIIQRSGEVMRDRIVANLLQCGALAEGDYLNAIRALPSVTLEDLR